MSERTQVLRTSFNRVAAPGSSPSSIVRAPIASNTACRRRQRLRGDPTRGHRAATALGARRDAHGRHLEPDRVVVRRAERPIRDRDHGVRVGEHGQDRVGARDRVGRAVAEGGAGGGERLRLVATAVPGAQVEPGREQVAADGRAHDPGAEERDGSDRGAHLVT